MNTKNKPKVLCTTTRLMRGGGVERTIELAVQELGDEFDFHVLSGVDVAYNPFENDPKVKLIVLEDMLHKIHPWYDLKAIWKMSRLIRKEKYDIVHTNETKASLVSRLAAKLAGHKYVVYQLHGVTFNDPMSSLRRSFLINVEKFTVWAADII
ncbi:MAG: glycosyltransferase, partial [Bacteroidota bacterium]